MNFLRKGFLTLMAAAAFFSACSDSDSSSAASNEPNADSSADSSSELREKIAQMLVVGFRGTTPEQIDTMQVGAKQYVKELGVGGVLLLTIDVPSGRTRPRNVESPSQLKELNSYLRSLASTPLMVAIDQEGGTVIRLDTITGFPHFPSAQWLGTQPVDSTTKYSELTADILNEELINVNYTPCVDVNVNPQSAAIGARERSYSDDPAQVTKYAGAWIDGHHDRGVLTALKHFPGHGSAADDSHLGMTDVTDTWQEYELDPYRDLIKQGKADMVMIAHVFNKNQDSEYPASLSSKIIDGILRKQLGFDGLVVSDDLSMDAIVDYYSFETALEKAINAGTDMIIIGNNGTKEYDPELPYKAVDAIENLVKEGKIPESRIEDAYSKIMDIKKKMK